MSYNMQIVIDYMVALKNRGITYSMTGSRNGTDGTGDCSGTIVEGLAKAGLKYGWLYNTDSMHKWLRKAGFKAVFEGSGNYTPKKGDIFVWGVENQSGGAFGHTGIFYDDSENIIHCNYGYNGVTINNVDFIHNANGNPYYYIYRQTGTSTPTPAPTPSKPKPPVTNGKRRYGYRIDDVQTVHGVLQVRNNVLVPSNFTWTDNGIPTIDIDIINPSTGEMLADQNTVKTGLYFAINQSRVSDSGKNAVDDGNIYRSFRTTYGDIWLKRAGMNDLVFG